MNTVLRKHAVWWKSTRKTTEAYPDRMFTPLKRGINEFSLILILAGALLTSLTLHAQTPVFNCSCLSTQAVLFTNTCCGVIPNLCPVASNCYSSSVVPPPGYTCSQTPAPGTP